MQGSSTNCFCSHTSWCSDSVTIGWPARFSTHQVHVCEDGGVNEHKVGSSTFTYAQTYRIAICILVLSRSLSILLPDPKSPLFPHSCSSRFCILSPPFSFCLLPFQLHSFSLFLLRPFLRVPSSPFSLLLTPCHFSPNPCLPLCL